MTTYAVGDRSYTARQIAVLCQMAKAPLQLDGLGAWDRNAVTALEECGCVTENDEAAVLTAKGRAVIAAVSSRVNGAPPPGAMQETATKTSKAGGRAPRRDSRERPATEPAKRESPPPTGMVDFSTLRAQIVAHYEADLAALTRLEEIAKAIA